MSNQSSNKARSRRSQEDRRRYGRVFPAILVTGSLLLTGCGGNVIRQGHLFQEEDLAQVHEGMSKDQVVLALGTPDTQSAVAGGAYYYISQTAVQQMAFLAPEVTDRRIVAIYFNNKDRVEQIANYGMKDGKVFDFVKRQTPSYSRDPGILRELFRNIGVAPTMPTPGGGNTPGN
jgi:outer membrane protein assembly factor BamE (lipoprotein component of BamABCDE complex)